MSNYPFNVEMYNSVLKAEVVKLAIIAIVLTLIFVFVIVYSAIQIKSDKTKKTPYIQLFLAIVIGVFLLISLSSQISLLTKDIAEETYVQYKGSANIRAERQIIFGGIPTGYTEYIISFEQEGKAVELAMRKDYGLIGSVEEIYIVYSQQSNFVLEFVEGKT